MQNICESKNNIHPECTFQQKFKTKHGSTAGTQPCSGCMTKSQQAFSGSAISLPISMELSSATRIPHRAAQIWSRETAKQCKTHRTSDGYSPSHKRWPPTYETALQLFSLGSSLQSISLFGIFSLGSFGIASSLISSPRSSTVGLLFRR